MLLFVPLCILDHYEGKISLIPQRCLMMNRKNVPEFLQINLDAFIENKTVCKPQTRDTDLYNALSCNGELNYSAGISTERYGILSNSNQFINHAEIMIE